MFNTFFFFCLIQADWCLLFTVILSYPGLFGMEILNIDRLLSNLIFSCFLNMMRQAPVEPYDTLVNTSSCLTLFFFFDAGRLVFTLLYIPMYMQQERVSLTPFLWNNITYAKGRTYI